MASKDHVPEWGCLPCPVEQTLDFKQSGIDCIVLVASSIEAITGDPAVLQAPLKEYMKTFAPVEKEGAIIAINVHPSAKRLVYSPAGPNDKDYDDIRRYAEAAEKGMKRAIAAGSKRPMLVPVPHPGYKRTEIVTMLGALQGLYVPIEIREAGDPKKVTKVEKLVIFGVKQNVMDRNFNTALGLEQGRFVARDIGGSDPERMAAPRVAEYMKRVLAGTDIKISVESEDDSPPHTAFKAKYPLLAAVNRAASVVPRHRARVIHLEYVGEEPVQATYMLVGKGITYDTGGLDIKAGGVMAGMHRDKCGAAAVGGFFKALSELKPKSVRVIGVMCMVRNSVGAEGYVADEIITSRAGVRVRVGNTDAEGRMVMADLLALMKERAVNEKLVNPHLLTVATLTGHACLACGDGYSSVMDNGPARQARSAYSFYEVGENWGEPFEMNTVRREDFEFHTGKSEYEDVLQCNNAPSSRTPRGHQGPAAFLMMASGLTNHQSKCEKPIKYTHLDIAASSGPFPGVPTGAPIVGMAANFFGNQI